MSAKLESGRSMACCRKQTYNCVSSITYIYTYTHVSVWAEKVLDSGINYAQRKTSRSGIHDIQVGDLINQTDRWNIYIYTHTRFCQKLSVMRLTEANFALGKANGHIECTLHVKKRDSMR